jgi:hypothetical protein
MHPSTTSNIAKGGKREEPGSFHFLRFRKKINNSQTQNSYKPPTATSVAISSCTSVLASLASTAVTAARLQQSTTEPPPKTQLGKTIADAKLPPASQSGPTRARAWTDIDTVPSTTSRTAPESLWAKAGTGSDTAPATTNRTVPESLWEKAVSELDMQESATLVDFIRSNPQDMASVLENIRDETQRIMDANRETVWKINVNDQEIVMEDIGIKILVWIDKFKVIGNVAAQVDPVHAALPWAIFRFLLEVGPPEHCDREAN